jgi:steroid 5-alpha reductase family enzyme
METLVLIWLVASVAMTAGWWWQHRHTNIGIVDALWAASVGMSALAIAIQGQGGAVTRTLLAVLATAWAGRLAWHVWRRVRSEPEDGRYAHLRQHWAGHQGKIFGFFQLQALLVVLFALPFTAVADNPDRGQWGWWAAALATWVLSVTGEATADRQLARFRADPTNRGKTCRSGLWRYSRHPNYFFEWLHWFTYVFLAAGATQQWLAWAGPVLMYVCLRWISGIPFTEQQALRSRGQDYRRYQRSTPMLIPWFPSENTAPDKESAS